MELPPDQERQIIELVLASLVRKKSNADSQIMLLAYTNHNQPVPEVLLVINVGFPNPDDCYDLIEMAVLHYAMSFPRLMLAYPVPIALMVKSERAPFRVETFDIDKLDSDLLAETQKAIQRIQLNREVGY